MKDEWEQEVFERFFISPREQEIFKILLKGVSPKKAAFDLNISKDTVLFHQRNIYRKFGVKSIHELIVKYYTELHRIIQNFFRQVCKRRAFEKRRRKTARKKLSSVDTCMSIRNCSEESHAWLGIIGCPEFPALRAVNVISSFSFKVLGDGNIYTVEIVSADTFLENNGNHYYVKFSTEKDRVTTITVNVDDLAQRGYGSSVPFTHNDKVFLLFHPLTHGQFNLKVWDIRFF